MMKLLQFLLVLGALLFQGYDSQIIENANVDSELKVLDMVITGPIMENNATLPWNDEYSDKTSLTFTQLEAILCKPVQYSSFILECSVASFNQISTESTMASMKVRGRMPVDTEDNTLIEYYREYAKMNPTNLDTDDLSIVSTIEVARGYRPVKLQVTSVTNSSDTEITVTWDNQYPEGTKIHFQNSNSIEETIVENATTVTLPKPAEDKCYISYAENLFGFSDIVSFDASGVMKFEDTIVDIDFGVPDAINMYADDVEYRIVDLIVDGPVMSNGTLLPWDQDYADLTSVKSAELESILCTLMPAFPTEFNNCTMKNLALQNEKTYANMEIRVKVLVNIEDGDLLLIYKGASENQMINLISDELVLTSNEEIIRGTSPETPRITSVTNSSDTEITIDWNNEYPEGTKVYFQHSQNGEMLLYENVNTATVAKPTDGAYYYAYASNLLGYSNTVMVNGSGILEPQNIFVWQNDDVLMVPDDLHITSVTNSSNTEITIDWDNEYTDDTRVYFQHSQTAQITMFENVNTATVPSTSNGDFYYAYAANMNGYSNMVMVNGSGIIDPQLFISSSPEALHITGVTNTSDTEITIDWDNQYPDGTKVYFQHSQTADIQMFVDVKTATVTNPTKGYFYYAYVSNDLGYSNLVMVNGSGIISPQEIMVWQNDLQLQPDVVLYGNDEPEDLNEPSEEPIQPEQFEDTYEEGNESEYNEPEEDDSDESSEEPISEQPEEGSSDDTNEDGESEDDESDDDESTENNSDESSEQPIQPILVNNTNAEQPQNQTVSEKPQESSTASPGEPKKKSVMSISGPVMSNGAKIDWNPKYSDSSSPEFAELTKTVCSITLPKPLIMDSCKVNGAREGSTIVDSDISVISPNNVPADQIYNSIKEAAPALNSPELSLVASSEFVGYPPEKPSIQSFEEGSTLVTRWNNNYDANTKVIITDDKTGTKYEFTNTKTAKLNIIKRPYKFKAYAENVYGTSETVTFPDGPTISYAAIILSVIGIFLFILLIVMIIICCVCFYWARKKKYPEYVPQNFRNRVNTIVNGSAAEVKIAEFNANNPQPNGNPPSYV